MSAPDRGHPAAGLLIRLCHSIQHLAQPGEVQLQLLPDFVCKADELALQFDHWREVATQHFGRSWTDEQHTALRRLDDLLTTLTDGGEAEEWTDEAVLSSGKWAELRAAAADALRAFGWPPDPPPSYAHEYIGGNPAAEQSA